MVALAAVGLFLRTTGFDWVYDDQMEVVRNTFIRSFTHLPDIFTTTVWMGSGMETYLYRPLALVTYALNYAVSGADPASYHLVNVGLHALVAVLVVRVARGWGLAPLAAGLAGLLFAVHPLHVEAVVPVFGRKDLLATAFILGMALCHRGALAGRRWQGIAAPLLYLAAMLSKEVGVVGVAMVLAQDLWLAKDRRAWLARREVPLLYAAYFLAAALYLLVRNSVIGGLGIPDTSPFDNPLVGVGVGTRLVTAWVVVMKGLGLLAFPLRQSPDYSFDAIPVVAGMGDPRVWASLGATGLLAMALLNRRVRRSPAPLAALWYGLALLPASNLLVVSGTIFAERLLYLPSAAFCVVAGAALAEAARRWPRAGWVAAGVVILLLAGQSWRYSSAWTDDVALFRHAAAAVPTSTKAHHKLGEELLRRGEHGDALRSLHRALAVAPTNGYAAETLATARRLVAERHYGPARSEGTYPEDPAVLYALGAWALEASDTAVALEAVERAVALDPTLARGWLTLALIARDRGEEAVAQGHLRRFLSTAGELYPQEQAWARSVLPGVR